MRQRVDLAFMTEKVAVDVRGCFWHRCPAHGSEPTANAQRWADKLARNVERDAQTVEALTDMGWQVVVVWEHEDPVEAANRVETAVRGRRSRLTDRSTRREDRAAG